MKEDPSSAVQTEHRRLAAIMFTDIVGFSRQMGANEARTLRLLAVHNQVIEQALAAHHGHIIKTFGDAFLVDFPSVVHAVQCAQRIQTQFRAHNAEHEQAEQIHIRIGIHLGDIVVQPNGDVLGDGVNIASRLQALAEPDTICLSQKVYEEVEKKLSLGAVVLLGRPKLKNIAPRFQVYALLPEKPTGVRHRLQVHRLKLTQWRRPLQGAALLVLLASAGLIGRYFYTPSPVGLPLPDKPSIVVLPFVNMSNDPEQEYFSDGVTEDVTTDLSRISSLFVIARNSAFTYKGKAVKVQEVSRELGVRYVLEGSVRKAGDRVRVTAQLIDGTTGGHLWSERYDRPLTDIFTLQDEIVQQLVATLKLQLTLWEKGVLVRKSTDSVEAYDYYLRGLEYFFRSAKDSNLQARQMFERAVATDPQYVEAYARLGFTYWLEWIWQWSHDPEALEQAFTLGQKAVSLNDSVPAAHSLLSVASLWKRLYDQAVAEGERAIALDPNNSQAYRLQAEVLVFCGRPEDGIKLIEEAMRLNPHYSPDYQHILGIADNVTGRYEEAIVAFKKVLVRNPNFMTSHLNLAIIYSELGREDEARAEAAEVIRLSPSWTTEVWKRMSPLKDPAVVERFVAGARKAGLK